MENEIFLVGSVCSSYANAVNIANNPKKGKIVIYKLVEVAQVEEKSETNPIKAYKKHKAQEYYQRHRDKILEQQRQKKQGQKTEQKQERFVFTPEIVKILLDYNNETPLQLVERIRKELNVNIKTSQISNWRHNNKNLLVKKAETTNLKSK